jgi:serine/threonine protein kinase
VRSPALQDGPPVTPKSEQKFAVKIIRCPDQEYQRVAIKEYHMLKKLKHERIIRVIDAFINQIRETIFMVMELVKGFTLKKYVKKHQKAQAFKNFESTDINQQLVPTNKNGDLSQFLKS